MPGRLSCCWALYHCTAGGNYHEKILITGAGGFVGSRILQQWQGKYELCALPKGFFCTADEALTRAQVEALHPDVILHTAALSDTSYCAQHPAEAYRANVELPVWLARAAQQTKAKLVAFSSDQVYAGVQQQGPLPETLALHPANIYGQYKLKAEQRVLELCPDSVHLRASWMYDLPGYGLPIRGNLPLNLLRAALKGEALRFSRNDHRGVTYVRQVIENLEPAMTLPGGVYNLAAAMLKHGMHRPAVCRNAGNRCADRGRKLGPEPCDGHHKTGMLRHPVRHHSAGHPALFKRLRAENAVKFPYRTKIK